MSMRSSAIFVIAIAMIGASLLGLRFAESWFLFPAPPAPVEAPALRSGIEHVWLERPDIRVEAFLLLPQSEERVPLIVYAHGNGELIDDWLSGFKPAIASGVAVLLIEYPGYGRSMGTPSEESIQSALAAGYDWAIKLPMIDARRVVGYGSSLGGGAICALARVRPLAALILESTFTSFGDLVAERPAPIAVFRNVVRNRFDNLAVVRAYNSPVLVLHGHRDRMIPVSHAHQLAAAARVSELEIAQCGHNDCPRSWTTLLRFLSKHGFIHSRVAGPAAQQGVPADAAAPRG